MAGATTLLVAAASVRAESPVWQGLFFDPHIFYNAWWVLLLGLVIEYPAFRWLTGMGPVKTVAVTVALNVVSFFAGMLLQWPTQYLSPGPHVVIAIFAIGILGNTAIEWVGAGLICRRWNRGGFSVLLLVNILSVMAAILTAWYFA